jgi:hypothetical protein
MNYYKTMAGKGRYKARLLTMPILVFFAVLLVSSCYKSEHNSLEGIEYRNVIVYYNNGEYIDNGYIHDGEGYSCNQICECPLVAGGQSYSDLCKVSYTFLYKDVYGGYNVYLQYTTVDSVTNFAVDSSFAQPYHAYYHIDKARLYDLFAPQSVRFAAHTDSLGCYISFINRKSQRQYTSIPTTNISVNTDPRFYFRFIDTTRIAPYGNGDVHSPAFRNTTHKISARGQFSAVLYSNVGDSITISGGEFRLPFCE